MPNKYASNKIKLVAIEGMIGAHYNPRQTDKDRLECVVESLEYLGFLMPLYINKQGVLLSGHQRTKAAKLAGYTHLPVVEVDLPSDIERGVNLLFNQATNDMQGTEKAADVFKEFLTSHDSVRPEGSKLPPDTFTCMDMKKAKVDDLVKLLPNLTTFTKNVARRLVTQKIFMPIVKSGDRIINGVARLYALREAGYTHCDVVEVPEALADYAHLTLNLLSMDFDLQSTLKDDLRFNAFRRRSVSAQLVGFSQAWSYFVFNRPVRASQGSSTIKGEPHPDLYLLPHLNNEVKRRYKDTYGDTIIDFGAGTLHDAELAMKGGLTVHPFEPYHLAEDSTKADPPLSKARCAEWVEAIHKLGGEGKKATAIISSFMLNSIPHHKDRMACLAIINALCGLRTNVFITTQSVKKRAEGSARDEINPNMEPNMTLGMNLKSFKVQKFFYEDELEKMLRVFFNKVSIKRHGTTLYAQASLPKRVNPKILGEALEIEFDLPYCDGTRMGLVEEAKKAFTQYCGVPIP